MPKKTTPLSDIQVRNAKPKSGKPTKLFDGDGLFLLVDANGNRGWRLKYRIYGKEKLMSLGPYPEVSLSDARALREKFKGLVVKGIDPIQARVRERRDIEDKQKNTFERIAREWHSKQTTLADKTRNLHMRRLEADILPAIGKIPITEIYPKLILDKVLRPMERRGVGEMTHRVKSIISQIFRYGVACGYVERDATTDLAGALIKVERTHFAAITEPAELAKLLKAIDGYDGYFAVKCALQLAPLVFVRPGELRSMKWANLDLKEGEWRYLVPKTKTEHIVPLSRQALAILKKLQPISGAGEFVFPSVRSVARPISDNTLNAALRRLGYGADQVTTHGFRATARTILEEVLHEKPEYIEQQLAHSVKDPLGRAYNRTRHLSERRRMMQVWSDYLDGLKQGARVIPMKKAK